MKESWGFTCFWRICSEEHLSVRDCLPWSATKMCNFCNVYSSRGSNFTLYSFRLLLLLFLPCSFAVVLYWSILFPCCVIWEELFLCTLIYIWYPFLLNFFYSNSIIINNINTTILCFFTGSILSRLILWWYRARRE